MPILKKDPCTARWMCMSLILKKYPGFGGAEPADEILHALLRGITPSCIISIIAPICVEIKKKL